MGAQEAEQFKAMRIRVFVPFKIAKVVPAGHLGGLAVLIAESAKLH